MPRSMAASATPLAAYACISMCRCSAHSRRDAAASAAALRAAMLALIAGDCRFVGMLIASGGGGGGTCAAHIGICIGIDGGEGTSMAAGGGMLTAAVQRWDERVGGRSHSRWYG